ncbi:MAG: hypothetical protein N3B14_05340 [Thermoleophilia bacterium]|nr:hypothetical protein [Thermoleophilia bacterium]
MKAFDLSRVIKSSATNVAIVMLLAAALAAGVAGCWGAEEPSSSSAPGGNTTAVGSGGSQTPISTEAGLLAYSEQLSTFQAKDPFIPKYVPTTASSTTTSITVPTTAAPTSTTSSTVTTIPTTTTTQPPTTTTSTTTTSTTTSTTSTTTTISPLHVLKVLSVDVVGEAPAVTIKVDEVVYKDRRVGDVLSTTWGEVRILDISLSSKVVTLLHEGEVLWLEAGQVVREWP